VEWWAIGEGGSIGEIVAPRGTTSGPLVVLYGDDLVDIQRRFHFTNPDGYELAVWSAS